MKKKFKKQVQDPEPKDRLNVAEFRSLLKIDRHDLDEEIQQQPTLYYQVAAEEVRVRSLLDKAESDLEYMAAALDSHIREEAENADESITESGVKSKIRQHKEYRSASALVIVLKERVGNLGVLKDSFRSRSYMLRDLVELYVAGYYTDAAVKGSSDRHKGGKAERIRERLSEKRKERVHD